MTKLLSCRIAVLLLVGSISLFSLLAALASEVFWGLEPCILCIYQRIPFLAVVIFAVLGFAFKRKSAATNTLLGMSALAFLINSMIAFYHTGVEQKWWISAVEGCAVPADFGMSEQSMLENILSAPSARCDEIPWADPVLGLSMANYNVILCLGLFALCAASLILVRKKAA
ncbi:MAG: disulfide bond formation protein B [Alphaproteobacteria bacterium]|nr:disulfide bond formation protein B [Alphaproteobacteria bacterium]